MFKTHLSGLFVTVHPSLCKQYPQSLSLTALAFLFRTHPRAMWQQNPPEQVLIT